MKNLTLSSKLIISFLVIGLVPMIIIYGVINFYLTKEIQKNSSAFLQTAASDTMDKIERNLFERYGDVQAFTANTAVQNHEMWYVKGSENNVIADAMNQYVSLYGIYPLMLAVDLEGKVIAVNDQSANGARLETSYLYDRNFRDATWFKGVMSGRYLRSDALDGTFVEDVYRDEDISRVYGGSKSIISYSAAIRDKKGQVIGVWNNRADIDLVNEIIQSSQEGLSRSGLTTSTFHLIDSSGKVLSEVHSQSAHATVGGAVENLVQKGFSPAIRATRGESGFEEVIDPDTKNKAICGFSKSVGALGYPGLGWAITVHAEKREVMASINATIGYLQAIMGMSVLGLSIFSWWLGRSLTAPVLRMIERLNLIGSECKNASDQLATNSEMLANGASQQAAALEETGSSLEEMTSMTRRNAENTEQVGKTTNQTRITAETGLEKIQAMDSALKQSRQAVEDMRKSVKAMHSSGIEVTKIINTIDEIAFQTNILALNAAVEAARAGEAGRGCAVVADEVRNRAKRSAEAAKQTAQKIENSIQASDSGVTSSEQVVSALNEIESKADEVNAGFRAVLDKIKSVEELVSEIANASAEQHQGIDQINAGVNDINKVTQSNAANAEETASASAQLKSQAFMLDEILGELRMYFKGGEGSSGSYSSAPHAGNYQAQQPQRVDRNRQNHSHGQSHSRGQSQIVSPRIQGNNRVNKVDEFDKDFQDF
jgi:hypothetical protein